MMRVLITGVGGFVGNVIGKRLNELGHDVTGTIHARNRICDFPTIQCDLSSKWCFQDSFDIIIHTAGILPYKKCGFNDFYRNNIVTMEQLIEFAVEKKLNEWCTCLLSVFMGSLDKKMLRKKRK